MKQPAPHSPPRPFRGSRVKPRSGTEAAIQLVRVEFDRARHRRELDRLRRRAAAAVRSLDELEEKGAELLACLGAPLKDTGR
ncbi:MAG: hypothetical protein ACFCGT_27930 [Sandaracinaceae bacterium]